jgi:hypothetical protein
MAEAPRDFRELVERLGGHPAGELGIDLSAKGGPERWFVAACVLAERAPRRSGLAAVRALARAGLAEPRDLAKAGPDAVFAVLAEANHPRAEPLAHRLARAGTRLTERHGGTFDALAAECEDLEALGGCIAALASGVGRATVLRFLRPLRDRWSAAAEVPLDPAARRAAVELGWLAEGNDEEGAPLSLQARLADEPDPPSLADAETALARLR